MANYHDHSSGEPLINTNPWAEESGLNQPHLQQPLQPQQAQQGQQAQHGYQTQQGNQTQQWNTQSGYQAPPGPPPPRRTDAFQDENILPAEERGEQREAMETFEMNNTKPESEADRAVAALQNEFPTIDGSLIAAIFNDSHNVGATREMLQELASSQS